MIHVHHFIFIIGLFTVSRCENLDIDHYFSRRSRFQICSQSERWSCIFLFMCAKFLKIYNLSIIVEFFYVQEKKSIHSWFMPLWIRKCKSDNGAFIACVHFFHFSHHKSNIACWHIKVLGWNNITVERFRWDSGVVVRGVHGYMSIYEFKLI